MSNPQANVTESSRPTTTTSIRSAVLVGDRTAVVACGGNALVNPLAGAIGLLIVALALDVWTYVDANARQGTRREISVSIGSFTLETPLVWFLGCVILFVVFFPLYLVARREASWTTPRQRLRSCRFPLWIKGKRDRKLSVVGGRVQVMDEVIAAITERVAGEIRYRIACQAHDLPVLGLAWRAGTIDARKVSLIADQLRHLVSVKAAELASAAVTYAAQHTPAQTRAWLARRVVAADPKVAETRRESAMAERCVVITPVEDGMADLSAC